MNIVLLVEATFILLFEILIRMKLTGVVNT